MVKDVQCTPHPNTVTKMDGGDYGTYVESGLGRKPLPFALAEKIDNAIAATKVALPNVDLQAQTLTAWTMHTKHPGDLRKLWDNPPELKKLVEVFFLFDNDNILKNICIRDNGSGMDTDGLRAYATYNYSQDARQRDGSLQKAPDAPASARGSDPQALDGRIGHFGVGGQHSVFFMGFMEHIMTKTRDDGKVNDMVISGEEMHKRWDDGQRDEVYNFKVHRRKPGDGALLHGKKETHPYLSSIIERERDVEKSPQFSLFVISDIKPQHVEALREFNRGQEDDEGDEVVRLTEELARVYHYYLHGRDGDVEPNSSSDSEAGVGDSESEESDDAEDGGRKRRRQAQLGGSAARRRRGGERGPEENISVRILFHAYREGELKYTTDLFEVDNVEKIMHRRARGDPFRIGLKPSAGVQVDEFEEVHDEEPILSCYWQGRWIPYAQVKKLKFLEVTKDSDTVTKLQGRIRGTIWFPRNVLPSNNKLFLQKSPEAMMSDPQLRVYQLPNWDDENQKGVRAAFRKWLQDCSAQYDLNLEFKDRIEYDSAGNKTHYGALRYGHAEYRKNDKVKLRKGVHVYGVVEHFICAGNGGENAVGGSGDFAYRRYPLEIFGGQLYVEHIDKLSSKQRDPEELKARLQKWNDEVDLLKQKTPRELAVLVHRGGDEADARLRPKKMSFPLGGGSGPDWFPKSMEKEAGFELPALDVYVVSDEGKPATSVLTATKRSALHVQLKIKKLTDVGMEGSKQRKVETFVVEGNNHLQKKPNLSSAFEFPSLIECFEGAGDYEVTFHVPGFHRKALVQAGPDEGKWMPDKEPITWMSRVTIHAAKPAYFGVQYKLQKPLLLGYRTKGSVLVSLRDQYRSPGSKKSQGNLCFIDGQIPKEDFEIECKVTKPEKGLQVSMTLTDRQNEVGWFEVEVKCTPVDDEKLPGLGKSAGKLLEVKGTISVRMKVGGRFQVLDPLDDKQHFEFQLGPGRPKKLVWVDGKEKGVVTVENHAALPQIKVQALDQWGHVVVRDKAQQPLRIREVLECHELKKEIKNRSERAATWEPHEAAVDLEAGYAAMGQRTLRLEQPRVTSTEKHGLAYALVTQREEGGDASRTESSSSKGEVVMEVNVDVTPSSLPHDVRAFRGDAEIEDGVVQAAAGSSVGDIRFQFYDEAGNAVKLRKSSGWVVRGGGWERNSDAAVCDPITMPPLKMRTKAGDTLDTTVVFTGPALESHHPPKLPVDLSLVPHPAAPKQWLFAEPEGDAPCKEVLQLGVGQLLREGFCLQLQDEFSNVVGEEECEGFAPKLLMLKQSSEKLPEKKGDWDTFERVGNRFLPAADAGLEGAIGAMQFMASMRTAPSGGAARVENCKQPIQVVCGKPDRLRMSLVGTPSGQDIDDVAAASVQAWKSCCVIDRVVVQVVDAWGNPVDRLREKLEVVLEIEGGTLQAELAERNDDGDKQLRGQVKKESGERVWKKVKIRMSSKLQQAALKAHCPTGNIKPASLEVRCKPCNKATKLLLGEGQYDAAAPQLQTGDPPGPLQLRVKTEDGHVFEGSDQGIQWTCVHESNERIELFAPEIEKSSGGFTLQPREGAVFEKTGTYTLMVWYEERRPALLETLMQCDQQLPAEKREFTVKAGRAHRLEISECKVAAGCTAAVSNGSNALHRQVAQAVALRVLDEFGNKLAISEKWKVGASVQPVSRSLEEATREIFCDLEFVFCNDAERAKAIASVRERLSTLEKEKAKAVREQEEKRKKVLNFQRRFEAKQAEVVQRRDQAVRRGVPREVVEDKNSVQSKILALRQAVQHGHQRRRPKRPRNLDNVLDIAYRKYGTDKVLGTILDLCYIDDDNTARIVCWRLQTDLKTIIFRYKNDASDFIDLHAARTANGGVPPRVLSLEVAAKWSGHREPNLDYLPHYKNEQAALNDRMGCNMMRFYDSANEQLRESVLWALVGNWVVMDSRQEAMEYMASCRQQRRHCPEMLAKDDGGRIQSNGVMGGANNCAPTNLDYLECFVGSADQSGDLKQQLEALEQVVSCEKEYDAAMTHYNTVNATADEQLQTVKRKSWELEKESNRLHEAFEKARKEQAVARNPTPNTPYTPISPGRRESNAPPALAHPDGTLGLDTPTRFVSLNKDGTGRLENLELAEGSGRDEAAYALRFQIFNDKNQPVHRQREADVPDPLTRDDFHDPSAAPPSASASATAAPPATPGAPTDPPPATTPRQPPSAAATPRRQQETPLARDPHRNPRDPHHHTPDLPRRDRDTPPSSSHRAGHSSQREPRREERPPTSVQREHRERAASRSRDEPQHRDRDSGGRFGAGGSSRHR